MTRGLRWGVALGLLAGILTIITLDAHHVHGQVGGLLAAGATGIVIFVVSQIVDRGGRPPR
jgi:hypothetical protein